MGGCGIASSTPLGEADPAVPVLRVVEPRCESLLEPIGIDAVRPRLGWKLRGEGRRRGSIAYRVIVASSAEKLAREEGDLWDSGRIASPNTERVEYAGRPLRSRERAWWKARVWDEEGRPGPFGPVASFETGILRPCDWTGRWIARTTERGALPAPYLRREFELEGEVERARLYVAGLGYHEAWINGRKAGDHFLDPGYTRYDRRVLYVTHDVTELVRPGRNAIGVILGTGWYDVHTLAVWHFDKAPWRNSPRLLLELHIDYRDGRHQAITSDAAWRTATGPILYDSIYGGETYDARRERPGWDRPGYDARGWRQALLVEAPGGKLSAQACAPIRITGRLRPVSLRQPKPGVWIFDLGQNFAGVARLRLSGPAGTEVRLRYGEKLHEDGTLDRANITPHLVKTDPPQRFQTDRYILKGEGTETWHARFVYHGFQYVEVTGAPGELSADNLEGLVLGSDVPRRGWFECSNPLLERIYEATLWSFRSNFLSIPTDCPHREKNGWTGDAHLACDQALWSFDPSTVYEKWIDDLDDEQRESGELPGIVPTGGWGYQWGNGPAWDSAFLLIPWALYRFEGDRRTLLEHYPKLKRYVDYLKSRAEGGIVSIGLGDWVPWKTKTPAALTSTAYWYVDARIVSRVAGWLGREEEAREYAELAESIRAAFNQRFYDREKGTYASGSQTALACALFQGLVEPSEVDRVVARLVEAVEAADAHIDTGILGAKYLLRALTEHGRADLAYRIVTQRDPPGWGNWIERGATTLWEDWKGESSRNHIMFGDVSAWFFEALAGLRPDPDAPGFRRAIVRPEPVDGLDRAGAVYDSVRGRYVARWRKEKGSFFLDLEVPAGGAARVCLPSGPGDRIEESDRPAASAPGVEARGREGDRAVFDVGSGSYRFRVCAGEPAPTGRGR